MKRILQYLAIGLAVVALLVWAGTGSNRGWTKTSVAVKTLDEVTGIEGISYQKRFLPGLDFLGAALGAALLLGVISIFVNKQSYQDKLHEQHP